MATKSAGNLLLFKDSKANTRIFFQRNPYLLLMTMHISLAKIILLSAAFTLVVPESYAKRMGSGSSIGRQSTISRQRMAPQPPSRAQPAPPVQNPAPVQRSQPDFARRAVPPIAPQQPYPRQARSGWGGVLGGALLGLGLGSLMGSRDRDPNMTNQSEGSSGAGTDASGDDATQAGTVQQGEQTQQGSGAGPILLLGLVALVVYFLVRRARYRARGR